jgi:excisionase family DNA binding protein
MVDQSTTRPSRHRRRHDQATPPAPTRAQYVTLTAAAEAFDTKERTLRRWVTEGRLTGYRFGPRQVRVDLAEVEALLRPIPIPAAEHTDLGPER